MLSNYNNSQKGDLRFRKTEQALIASMFSLLSECRFAKLTVDKLCKEGQISRATFYAHFTDKYDLLRFWLLVFWKHKINETDTYEDVKELINQFISENKKILKNLLIDADNETFEVVLNFFCSILDIENAKDIDGKVFQKNIVVVNLYISGIVYYLLWQARNNFPSDVPMINDYSFDAIKKLWDWVKEK